MPAKKSRLRMLLRHLDLISIIFVVVSIIAIPSLYLELIRKSESAFAPTIGV